MKKYTGKRINGECIVEVTDHDTHKILPLYIELMASSPTGFEWGYGGSGPAQLAFAILMDLFQEQEKAWMYHQDFKWDVIAKLNLQQWEISEDDIKGYLRKKYTKGDF